MPTYEIKYILYINYLLGRFKFNKTNYFIPNSQYPY